MHGINESLTFIPVRIAILTVSDTRDLDSDTSGDILVQRLTDAGHTLAARELVRDDREEIARTVSGWIEDDGIDVVISTGGTGLTGRDVTPEAIIPLFEKTIEGVLGDFPSGQLRKCRALDTAIARRCGCRAWHLYLLSAGFQWCREGRVGQGHFVSTRFPPQAVQSGRNHAAPDGTVTLWTSR